MLVGQVQMATGGHEGVFNLVPVFMECAHTTASFEPHKTLYNEYWDSSSQLQMKDWSQKD